MESTMKSEAARYRRIGRVAYREYTDDEIKRAWSEEGQGHYHAMERGRWCVVVSLPSEDAALHLSQLFVGCIFAIPTCTHWDGATLSLYVGDAGSNALASRLACAKLVTGFLSGSGVMSTQEAVAWSVEESQR